MRTAWSSFGFTRRILPGGSRTRIRKMNPSRHRAGARIVHVRQQRLHRALPPHLHAIVLNHPHSALPATPGSPKAAPPGGRPQVLVGCAGAEIDQIGAEPEAWRMVVSATYFRLNSSRAGHERARFQMGGDRETGATADCSRRGYRGCHGLEGRLASVTAIPW